MVGDRPNAQASQHIRMRLVDYHCTGVCRAHRAQQGKVGPHRTGPFQDRHIVFHLPRHQDAVAFGQGRGQAPEIVFRQALGTQSFDQSLGPFPSAGGQWRGDECVQL